MDQQVSVFYDDDDDHLLLDDVNTQNSQRCWKCDGTGILQSADNILDEFDDDSPLLNDDCIGPLTMKSFHCHAAIPEDEHNRQAYRTLCVVCILCFVFMLLEVVGGLIAGSVAVMTDAAHLFADIIGFLVSILSIIIGKRAKTPRMTFGFHRVEVLGAFLSVLILWLLAGIFCYIAIERIWHNQLDINADIMMFVAAFGVVVNIIMCIILHGSHGIKSNRSHSHSRGAENANINVRAAAAHVIGDFVQSVGVLLASVVIKVYPNAAILDPICSVLFSVIVICVTFNVVKDSVLILSEANFADTVDVFKDLKRISGVQHVHSLHIWSLAPGKDAFNVHLAVEDSCERDLVLQHATNIVRRKFRVFSSAIQIERFDAERMTSCIECI